MLTNLLVFSKNATKDFIIKLCISLVLLCLVAPITISMKGEMPITMQTFVILFCAIAFGWRVGGLATLIYIGLGAAGLPVFSNYSSGTDKLLGPHGGFFFGFVVAAVLVGYLTELPLFHKPLAALMLWFLGHIVIIAMGIGWLMNFPVDWRQMLNTILPGALIKSAVGALLVQLIVRILTGRKIRKRAFED